MHNTLHSIYIGRVDRHRANELTWLAGSGIVSWREGMWQGEQLLSCCCHSGYMGGNGMARSSLVGVVACFANGGACWDIVAEIPGKSLWVLGCDTSMWVSDKALLSWLCHKEVVLS